MTNDELDQWVLETMKGVAQADTMPIIYGELRRAHEAATTPYVGDSRLSNMIARALVRLEEAFLIERLPPERHPELDRILSPRYRVLSLLESLARASA